MTAAVKFSLVIVALVCCMQFVEMARLRRDDAVAAPAPDITKTFETIFETLKTQIENSAAFKEITEKIADFKPEDAKALIDKVTSTAKEQFEKAGGIIKETVDTVSKDVKDVKTE